MNTPFMRSKVDKLVFSNSEHYCFDEYNFAFGLLNEGVSIIDIKTPIKCFTELSKKIELKGEIKMHFDFISLEGKIVCVIFDNGRMIYKNHLDGIMYQLIALKEVFSPTKPNRQIPNKFYNSPTRIYHSR